MKTLMFYLDHNGNETETTENTVYLVHVKGSEYQQEVEYAEIYEEKSDRWVMCTEGFKMIDLLKKKACEAFVNHYDERRDEWIMS